MPFHLLRNQFNLVERRTELPSDVCDFLLVLTCRQAEILMTGPFSRRSPCQSIIFVIILHRLSCGIGLLHLQIGGELVCSLHTSITSGRTSVISAIALPIYYAHSLLDCIAERGIYSIAQVIDLTK